MLGDISSELLEADAALPLLEIALPEPAHSGGSFLRNIFFFSASNLFYLLVMSAMTFVVPKWLSIDDFAMYRYFLLFGGFAGALHLGSLDGALIAWVKTPGQDLRRGWMPLIELIAIIHFAAATIGVVAVFLLTRGDTRTTWLLILTLLPVANGLALSQYALQAVRRFSTLSALTAFTPVCTLSCVIALHLMHRATGVTVIGAYLVSNGISAIVGILSLHGNVSWSPASLTQTLRTGYDYLVIGWSVLIFNLLANFISSADRFFIVAQFSTHDFAIYSFAGAVFYSVYLVMLSISKVVFPYLADTSGPGRNIPYARVREALVILWALSLSFYFPITSLINRALPRYTASMPIVRLLLLATASIILIQILHANYYRLFNRQRTMTAAAFLGAAATVACLFAVQHLHMLSAMAWATVIGCTVWGLLGEILLLRFMHGTAVSLFRTIAGLAVFMAIFLYASGYQHTLLSGFVLQLTLTVAATLAIFLPTLRSLRKVVLRRLERGR